MPREVIFKLRKEEWVEEASTREKKSLRLELESHLMRDSHREARPCCMHSALTLCDPTNCSPLGSSVHGILQARALDWVVISHARGSSQHTDWNCVSCVSWIGRILYHWATWEVPSKVRSWMVFFKNLVPTAVWSDIFVFITSSSSSDCLILIRLLNLSKTDCHY